MKLRMIHLFPTYSCNLKCKHCYVNSKSFSEKSHLEFSDDLFNKAISLINSENPEVIHIEGGEPLLYGRIFDLIKKIKNKDTLVLVSNGLLTNKKAIQNLEKSGLKNLVISLEGSNKKVNSILRGNYFDETVRTLTLLEKSKILVSLSTTVHKENLIDLENVIELALVHKISSIRFGVMLSSGRGSKLRKIMLQKNDLQNLISKFLDLKKKYPKVDINLSLPGNINRFLNLKKIKHKYITCDAGKNQIAIGPDGLLYPCYNLVNLKEMEAGDLKISPVLQETSAKIKRFCPFECSGHVYLGEI